MEMSDAELQLMLEAWQTIVLEEIFTKQFLPDELLMRLQEYDNNCVFCKHYINSYDDDDEYGTCSGCPIFNVYGYQCDNDFEDDPKRAKLFSAWMIFHKIDGAWNILEVIYDLCMERGIIGEGSDGDQ